MPDQAPEARRAADETMSWMRNSKRLINRIVANTTPHLRARSGYGALAGEEEQAKPKRVQVEVQ